MATCAEFLVGRPAIMAFLTRKRFRELEYRLIKEVQAYTGDHIAARCAYERHNTSGVWSRSHGNEQWAPGSNGLMRRREASINDVSIAEAKRLFLWPQRLRPADLPVCRSLASDGHCSAALAHPLHGLWLSPACHPWRA